MWLSQWSDRSESQWSDRSEVGFGLVGGKWIVWIGFV